MSFRVYDNYCVTAAEIRRRYALKYPELTLIHSDYRRRDGLSGLSLAYGLATEGRLVVIYNLESRALDDEKELVVLLQKMPNVRFLDNPLNKEGIRQAYNDLRAPWLPHNVVPRHDRRYKSQNP